MPAPNYVVNTKILRPVADVYRAIVDPRELEKYFVDRTDTGISQGAEIVWSWKKWGDYPVKVVGCVENQRVELEIDSMLWKKTAGAGYKVRVLMELQSLGPGETLLSISESGWLADDSGLKASHENCSGWTHMALCLKAFLEHGIDLRDF